MIEDMRIAPLILATVLLAGCSASLQANLLESERFSIASVTMGTERAGGGQIADAGLAFPSSAHTLLFNVQLTNVQKETTVTGYWMLEGDTGRFANHTLTVTPPTGLARFELKKGSDWPMGTYIFYVEATDGTVTRDQLFRYEIDSR